MMTMQTLQDSIKRLRNWHADHGATCPDQLFVADLHIVCDAAEKTQIIKPPACIFPDPADPTYHRLDPPVRR